MKLQPFSTLLTLLTLTASLVESKPSPGNSHGRLHRYIQRRDTDRLVFAHIIVGLLANRNGPEDWDLDMKRAKDVGIDAFALNIGTDDYTDKQLKFAYDSAAKNGMKCFISFDFNWWSTGSAQAVGKMAAQYGAHPAQLQVDGKIFVSTFAGDGLDASAVRSATGKPIYFAPNFQPSHGTSLSSVDCAFNWMGWPNNGHNRAPSAGQTGTVESGDQSYLSALGSKDYMAPVSPWFFTHYGKEVSYSKNWVFPGDTLWFDRWSALLKVKARFVEIVSWNDYGESHYVGPLNSPHSDDGASKWVNDMPHDGWLDMAKPFIAAYKAGASSVDQFIEKDQLVYWYRPQPKTANCDATDTCMTPPEGENYYVGKPNGWDTFSDSVFVVSLLKSAATLEVTSGSNKKSFQVPAGASIQSVPMGAGKQSFSLSRNGQNVLSGTSAKDIKNGCVCGIYNFNAYVGTLPPGSSSVLTGPGLSNFAKGLKDSTCAAKPSLSNDAPASPQTSNNAALPTNSPQVPSSSSIAEPVTSMTQPIESAPAQLTALEPTTVTITTDSPQISSPLPLSTSSQMSTIESSPPPPPPSQLSSSPSPLPLSISPSSSLSSSTCNAGTGSGNYAGLCAFSCSRGYCPAGPCVCTSPGAPAAEPPRTGVRCVPADGLDQSYAGLCAFACDRGYQPDEACKVVSE